MNTGMSEIQITIFNQICKTFGLKTTDTHTRNNEVTHTNSTLGLKITDNHNNILANPNMDLKCGAILARQPCAVQQLKNQDSIQVIKVFIRFGRLLEKCNVVVQKFVGV